MTSLNKLDPNIRHMLALLLLMVIRSGGSVTIENLSELAGTTTVLVLELENDRATLTAVPGPLSPTQNWRLN